MLVVIAGVLFGSLASVMVRCSTAPSLVLGGCVPYKIKRSRGFYACRGGVCGFV